MLMRLKYRLIVWFFDKPDSLSRRVEVENILLTHFKNGSRPTPEQCKELAFRLGVPTWCKKSRLTPKLEAKEKLCNSIQLKQPL